MSVASAYAQTASALAVHAARYDASLMAVFLVATIGMLVSTLVTLVKPQWFMG